MFAFKTARCPRRMRDGDFTLRAHRVTDLPILRTLFTPELFLEAGGAPPRGFPSIFSFWRWIAGTFQVLYVAERTENGGPRMVGFLGLDDMHVGRSLRLSLAIFRAGDRRRGYGRRILELFLTALERDPPVKTIRAEVLKTNIPSLHLFRGLGFAVRGSDEEKFALERHLGRL